MIRADGFYTSEFNSFWKKRVEEVGKAPLVIAGIGFDPRSLQSAKMLYESGIVPKLLPIDFSVISYGDEDGSLSEATTNNRNYINKFDMITDPLKIEMYDSQGRSIGGRTLVKEIFNIQTQLNSFSDIIIDIGGLPRTLFAPLMSFLINQQKESGIKNLHVASLPESKLDNEIVSAQILEPNFMYGFDRPTSDDHKFVWIPIIGKNDPARLRKIHNKIEKSCIETCPILPFRSNDPRLTDQLILNLKEVLFQEIRTFNNNIFYIDHRSPFFVYREIIELSGYYSKLLKDLPGEVKVLISPMDDKTSSVGAIIAAVEKKLPIMYADTISYKVKNGNILSSEIKNEPMEIWVAGEAYED